MPTLTGFAFGGSKPPSLQSQTFNANGTFTVPLGVTTLFVDIVGGGGNGSNGISGSGINGGGGNGGGGGYANTQQISTSPGSTFPVVVGAGGGNQSSFGTIVAPGGFPGVSNSQTGPANGSINAAKLRSVWGLTSVSGTAQITIQSNGNMEPSSHAGSGGSGGGGGGFGEHWAAQPGGFAGSDGGVSFPFNDMRAVPGSGNRNPKSGSGGGGGGSGSTSGWNNAGAAGGSGGGGNGGNGNPSGIGAAGSNGTINTGGGGGGGGGGSTTGGAGGSGASGYVRVWWIS